MNQDAEGRALSPNPMYCGKVFRLENGNLVHTSGDFEDNWRQLALTARFDSKDLAKLKKVSVRHLQRLFRASLGRTPQDWLNEQRILAAQHSLRAGDSVKKVSFDLGFKQSSHFCRQFKCYCKLTPTEFTRLG